MPNAGSRRRDPCCRDRLVQHVLFNTIGRNLPQSSLKPEGTAAIHPTIEKPKRPGDGRGTKEWEARLREEPTPPSSGGSDLQDARLRESLEDSNYVLLRIPIEIHLFHRSLQGLFMDRGQLLNLLGMSDRKIDRLRHAGLAHLPPPTPQPQESTDYVVSATCRTTPRRRSETPKPSRTSRRKSARWRPPSDIRRTRSWGGSNRWSRASPRGRLCCLPAPVHGTEREHPSWRRTAGTESPFPLLSTILKE